MRISQGLYTTPGEWDEIIKMNGSRSTNDGEKNESPE